MLVQGGFQFWQNCLQFGSAVGGNGLRTQFADTILQTPHHKGSQNNVRDLERLLYTLDTVGILGPDF